LQTRLSRAGNHGIGATGDRKRLLRRLISLWRDHRAVTSVEYAVIAGVMVFVVFTVSGPFSVALGNMFDRVSDTL